MPRQNCRASRELVRIRAEAEAAARALLTQGRCPNLGAEFMEEEMTMNRYSYHIPTRESARYAAAPPRNDLDVPLERVLEMLAGQNQLLVDILGAVNALTAAMLAAQCRP